MNGCARDASVWRWMGLRASVTRRGVSSVVVSDGVPSCGFVCFCPISCDVVRCRGAVARLGAKTGSRDDRFTVNSGILRPFLVAESQRHRPKMDGGGGLFMPCGCRGRTPGFPAVVLAGSVRFYPVKGIRIRRKWTEEGAARTGASRKPARTRFAVCARVPFMKGSLNANSPLTASTDRIKDCGLK